MLFEAYTALARNFPAGCKSLYGEQLGDSSRLWLAVDEQTFPSFLLAMQPMDTRTDISLRFIGVQFSRECEIVAREGIAISGTFTIIRLEENDPDLVRVFLRLLEEVFCGAEQPQTNREIGDRILELADLFRQIENSAKDILGLWGELFIISEAASRETATRCWCQHRNAKYDFVSEEFALEVKATLKATREHRFSLEQLRPSENLLIYIASIQLVQAHGGRTVAELMDEILGGIADFELRKAFFSLCLIKGGEDIYKANQKYLLLSREAGVAYFAASDIPVPQVEAGGPISRVKFDVRLNEVPQKVGVDRARLASFAG